jgi:predicted nucleic acid-binding protein
MRIVVDSNIILALAIPLAYSTQATKQMRIWQNNDTQLFAPALWSYEIITAVRKTVTAKVISPEKATEVLDYIFALDIQQVPLTDKQYHDIFNWATRLNHTQAYDAAYLTLAESLSADFWTADKRLANSAKQLGLSWVHHLD